MRERLREKKYRQWWIAGGLILLFALLGTGGVFLSRKQPASAVQENQVQTAIARRGDLVVYASGAGEVIPATEIELSFGESGTLDEVLVTIGEQVSAGQVLARLKTTQTEAEIAAAIADAELTVLKAQQTLDAIYEDWQLEAAQALLDVEQYQQELDDLLNSDTAVKQAWEALVEAQQAVEDAQIEYNRTISTASQASIDAAYAQVILAAQALERAKDRYEPFANKPDDNIQKAQLLASLSAAQQEYDDAVRNYNALKSTGDELDQEVAKAQLETAQAQLADAQREWERVKQGPTEGEIALAEANLAAAKVRWEILSKGPDPDEVALAEAELANAKAKLELEKEAQAVVELTAPIDGTIIDINTKAGDVITSSTVVMTIADLEHPMLELYLDETDLDKVAVGYEVDVVFDAFPELIFSGEIVAVNPSLQTVQNVKVVQAYAQLDPQSFAKPITLPVGLSATVDVIGGRAENAVLVPVEALREISPGEYAVFVMENGEPRLRTVEVGIMDITSAQIVSGLDVGEIVTTGIVETGE